MFTRSCIFLLLLSGALLTQAGQDGYLRQAPPLRLRVAEPLLPRPAVNERILALGKPVEVPAAETVTAEAEVPVPAEEPGEGGSAPEPIVVDTAPSDGTPGTAVGPLPAELEVVSPVGSEVEAARRLTEILSIFNTPGESRGSNRSTVIVAPPTFLPPQPVGSGPPSRAVYRSP